MMIDASLYIPLHLYHVDVGSIEPVKHPPQLLIQQLELHPDQKHHGVKEEIHAHQRETHPVQEHHALVKKQGVKRDPLGFVSGESEEIPFDEERFTGEK